MKPLELTGQRFGRGVVVDVVEYPRWRLHCDCGNEYIARSTDLRRPGGGTMSCGCWLSERIAESNRARKKEHRVADLPEHDVWGAMISRCTRQKDRRYADYGGRGISVCYRWRNSFGAFYSDMGPRPSSKHSIDRIDNDGNYEPGNCRWATASEQRLNSRTTIMVEHNGLRVALRNLCKTEHASFTLVRDRIKRLGWTLERALSIPAGPNGRPKSVALDVAAEPKAQP